MTKELYSGSENSVEMKKVLVKVFESQVSRFTKGLLEDPVEKIREGTVRLLDKYFRLLGKVDD